MDDPVVIDGRVVTFWEEIAGPRPSTPKELGTALKVLHRLRPPESLGLSQVAPLDKVRERIAAARALGAEERDFPYGLADRATEDVADVCFDLPAGTVHGDGHVDNLVRGADGRLAFVDLEECAEGHPEWDLVLVLQL
jgi:aminoglycoside phosphotransferase (APT) family kinase protein